MHSLRHAAVRAIFQQQPRCFASAQQHGSRFALLQQTAKPIAFRSLHVTRAWRSDEQEKKSPAESESQSESVQHEPSETEMRQEVREETIAIPEAADASSAASRAFGQARDALSRTAAATQEASRNVFRSTQSQRPQKVPSRILYVGNLFFEVTAAELEAHFSRFGTVTNTRIVTDVRGLSKGFGYVELADQESADRAIAEADQTVFNGRRMAVQYHERRERPMDGRERTGPANPPSKTLFIGNMSYQMSDRDLNDLFREVKDVVDVRVAIDRRSGQPRGFAHADFIDIEAAQRGAELLSTKVIYGRKLRVDFSTASSSTRPGFENQGSEQ